MFSGFTSSLGEIHILLTGVSAGRVLAQQISCCITHEPTPRPFKKCLRLTEARRLILSEFMDVASAAYSVGYESPSQFSREYKRMFGKSPKQNVLELRDMAEK
ncbi:TPA: helix-turn-helix transcriptional regulator [Klebsiella quasipneumoniae]|nr:helix-turn-helix transcriptional regulator [Klebsiella pneumoniae]HBR1531854.1 helix-turn-helix transcriptional regulator [Klebsiella quasipneumoniae subsp. quasipneumoniae]HDG7814741.1 helix-turn-helix transcriptional regulator [Klebsiella quasipneumoniae]